MSRPTTLQLDHEQLELRGLRPEEAPALIACLRRCYGETYLDPTLYDAERMERAMRAGLQQSLVAVRTNGEVVGHMSLTLRQRGDITAEAGTTLVDPRYRGLKIAAAVSRLLGNRAGELGLVGAHDYPVTVHAATQKLGAGLGIDTGLMLDNVPAEVSFNEMQTAQGRSGSLIRYLPFSAAPERDVFVPGRYSTRLSGLYSNARLVRHMAATGALSGKTNIAARFDAKRDILRIEVRSPGVDLNESVLAAMRGYPSAHAVQLDLRLCDCAAADAAESLRKLGFFYAGVLPEYREGDVLRLQRLAVLPDMGSVPVLSTPEQRELVTFILGEATETHDRAELTRAR